MNQHIDTYVLVVIAVISMHVTALHQSILEAGTEQASGHIWNFESDRVGEPPAGFSFSRTGEGRVGHWIVKAKPHAPSGTHGLAQLDTDTTDYRFPVAVVNEPILRDVRLAVKCKPVSGGIDQVPGSAGTGILLQITPASRSGVAHLERLLVSLS